MVAHTHPRIDFGDSEWEEAETIPGETVPGETVLKGNMFKTGLLGKEASFDDGASSLKAWRDRILDMPLRLVIMLYDAALGALDQAEDDLETGNEKACGDAIRMVHEITTELYLCLDFDQGGEVASDLGRIYSYILTRTQPCAPLLDRSGVLEIRHILNQLHCAWCEIDVTVSAPLKGRSLV